MAIDAFNVGFTLGSRSGGAAVDGMTIGAAHTVNTGGFGSATMWRLAACAGVTIF